MKKAHNAENFVHLERKNGKKPDAVVVLNGTPPSADYMALLGKVPIYAADGAAARLLDNNIIPDYIVGDLDSFRSSPHFHRYSEKVIARPDQNSTDFEKTVEVAMSHGANHILILGFHGGELDHTLNNLSILLRYSQKANVVIGEEGKFGIVCFQSVLFGAEEGEMVSLVPLPSATLTTSGLRWELDNETLAIGSREGARNRAAHSEVSVHLHSGVIFLFINGLPPFVPQCIPLEK